MRRFQLRCPFCENEETKVVDSRVGVEGVKRRRECIRCGLRFSTSERIQMNPMVVVKQDGRREEFNRDKVRGGVLAACAKRPVSVETIERLISDIERELEHLAKTEAPSSLIGVMVMEQLRTLDHVAYVRFASVYRNFQDIENFAEEVELLRQASLDPSSSGKSRTNAEAQLSLPFNPGAVTRNKKSPGRLKK